MLLSLTAIVLTLNEEINLPDCLQSLSWCPRTVVLDSGSVDSTQEIAYQYGADFYFHTVEGPFLFADQRNWALSHCSINTDWVLFIDADERVTPSLQQKICHFLASDQPENSSSFDACYLAPAYFL